jgi:hypothetical protein
MSPMRQRQRKFIGTIVMIVYVIIYALLVMNLTQLGGLRAAPNVLVYAVFGLGWILPLLPLIKWMEKADKS